MHEWYEKLTVNLAMGGSHRDDVPDTKGNMTDSWQSLFYSWFNNHANLSSDENHSDLDEITQATSFHNAFNGREKNSKLHERLVARNNDLGKRLYMVSEAKQERADKVWNTCWVLIQQRCMLHRLPRRSHRSVGGRSPSLPRPATCCLFHSVLFVFRCIDPLSHLAIQRWVCKPKI